MTLMMYYIGLNIYIYIFICVVKTHLCSTEAIDNVGLYNDVVIRAYNTDVSGDDNIISSSDETDSSSDDNLKHQNMI